VYAGIPLSKALLRGSLKRPAGPRKKGRNILCIPLRAVHTITGLINALAASRTKDRLWNMRAGRKRVRSGFGPSLRGFCRPLQRIGGICLQSPMRTFIGRALMLAAAAVYGHAQWVNYPTPGIPRTRDGKPNLSAPAPRASDGRPDLSGLWQVEPTPLAEMKRLLAT
jgi:hypothetical protein